MTWEAQGGLIMANYAYSDCCSVTGRVSYVEMTMVQVTLEEDQLKYTLAHNYAVTDNLAVITEVSLCEMRTMQVQTKMSFSVLLKFSSHSNLI